MTETAAPRRWLFTLTILVGSFLLFLVQPMIARMALPRLGGAPNVWNSAMLVYQALLLGGYAYAHTIGRFSLARQGMIHLAVLALAALSLPLGLADLAPPQPGLEVLWVPLLFVMTVGPAFFAVSAQAPLIQRWFAAHRGAGNPYPLYAASNLGSFAGLLTYPLLAEPLLSLGWQSRLWALGYLVLIALVALVVLSRRGVESQKESASAEEKEILGWRRIALWLALSAVPSGLMLSTTTFLTTDIMAMPLLWVIPLGLYLLSFSIAFAEHRGWAAFFMLIAPVILLVDGSLSMFAAGRADLLAAIASIVLLFVVAVALHSRLYDSRPSPSHLTRFYLIMSAGGALGGVFTALLAPVLFDWTWEHPLLILAAAALVPLGPWKKIIDKVSIDSGIRQILLALTLFVVLTGALWLFQDVAGAGQIGWAQWAGFGLLLLLALVLAARRWSYLGATLALLLSLGGITQIVTSLTGHRERSYFGIYSVHSDAAGDRVLMHGTTLHGIQKAQSDDPLAPTAYYSKQSGVGLVLGQAEKLAGPKARVGIVGLGVGTLACYRHPDQAWTFFEIDPVVLDYSTSGEFTFMQSCAKDQPVVIGDARLELERLATGSFDILVIDAFSSDAIPLHLLTAEAMDIYWRALDEDGILLIHITNRYMRLEPVLADLASAKGLAAAIRHHESDQGDRLFKSDWVAFARSPERLSQVTATAPWEKLTEAKEAPWSDDYASILPYLKWSNFL